MGLGQRIMTAFKAGVTAFNSYDQKALYPQSPTQWDNDSARLFRYHHLTLYYHNKIYSDLETYRIAHLKNVNQGLYRSTRSIYNPISRLCDLYGSKVYGGVLDMDKLTTGAIPIIGTENDAVTDGIRQLWRWSNWANEKSVYPLTGSMLGDVFLKVVDEREKQKVRLEVLHPGLFYDVVFDNVGNIKSCRISYEKVDPDTDKTYLYDEIVDQESFSTFKDGKEFGFNNDASGKSVSQWKNEYGFVPIVHVPHRRLGTKYGMSAGHKILDKVDEMNSVASRSHDQIAKVVNSMYQLAGVKGETNITFNENKGVIPVVHIPEGTKLEALVNPLDLAAVANAVQEMLREIERDTPELSLHRVREGGNLTAPGVRAAYSDAIDLIQEAAGNYDGGLVRANMMALTIGGIGGYRGFESFNANSYDNGDLEHGIGERSIIADSLSLKEKIDYLMQLGYPELALYEMGYSEDKINDYKIAKEESRAQALEDQLLAQETTRLNNMAGQAANRTNTQGILNVRQPEPA